MTSFQELYLLAAEAWLYVGEPRRAMPYARDLVDSPDIDEGLLLRAQQLLARAVGAAPPQHKTNVQSPPASARPVSRPPVTRQSQQPAPPPPLMDPNLRRAHPTQRTSSPPSLPEQPAPAPAPASFTLEMPGPEAVAPRPPEPPPVERRSGDPLAGPTSTRHGNRTDGVARTAEPLSPRRAGR